MGKIIELDKKKKFVANILDDFDKNIVNSIYSKYISDNKVHEYNLILEILQNKKDTIYKKRDEILLTFLFIYNKSYDFLVNLQWSDLDSSKLLIKEKSNINTKISKDFFQKLIKYKNDKSSNSKYVFSDKNDKPVTIKFLKSKLNSYKKQIQKEE